jgi:hypothetical protein
MVLLRKTGQAAAGMQIKGAGAQAKNTAVRLRSDDKA